MKVVLCTFAFPEFTAALARGLEGLCTPMLVVPEANRQDAGVVREVVTFPYRTSDHAWAKLRACAGVVSMIRKMEPDVIHFQGWSPLAFPFLGKLRRIPLVFSWHDPVPHSGEEDWPMHVTQRYLVTRSERVIVLTEAMRVVAQEACPRAAAKIRVVHHGDFDAYVEGPEERPVELAADDKFVLFFGRVSPYKGVEDLCAAFALAGLSEYKLVIAGKHLYPVSISDRELAGVVMMNQFISNDRLRYLFRHCSLVVIPYRDATQSGVLMLAYAFGKAVVATRVGGIPEMIQEGVNGVTVPPRNPKELAKAMREMLSDPELLQKMGEQGSALAAEHYRWGKIAADHLRVYQEAIGSTMRQLRSERR